MRKILFLLGLLASSSVCFGQGTSAITATITDTDGQTWNSGPYTIQLVNSSGQPIAAGGAYRIDTGATITNSFSGTLDGSGALSVTLTTTSNINPAGTKWKFGICPNTIPAVCGGTSLTITASGSLSSQLSASILPPRIGGGPGTQAYADVEVAATPNNSYLNVGSLAGLRCYGSSWAACGGGGGTPTGAAGGFLTGTYPNPGGPTATAAGQQLTATAAGTTYAAQSKIALDPRDFGADFNGHTVANATVTSGSNVITCPSSNCNFTAGMVGYLIYASSGGGGTNCQNNTIVTFGGANQTTITGFTNANSITVSGTSNTTGTGTVCLAWGPIDSTTALTNWWNAGGCTGSYQMPAGITFFSSPIMQPLAGCNGAVNAGYAYPGQTVKGAGVGSTFLMPVPNFTYTGLSGNCATKAAVGNNNIEHYEEFAVWGLGIHISGTLANTCLFLVGDATSAFRVDLVGWNGQGGGTTLYGVRIGGFTDTFEVGGSNYFGSVEMDFTSGYQLWINNFTSGVSSATNLTCGVQIEPGAIVTGIDNATQVCVEVNGSNLNSQSSTYNAVAGDAAAIYVGNTGHLNLIANDQVLAAAGDGINIFAGTGSTVSIANSQVAGTAGSFYAVRGAASNNIYDQGNNTFTAGGSGIFNGLGLWPLNNSQAGWQPVAGNLAAGVGFGTSPAFSAVSTNGDMRHFSLTLTVGSGAQTQATSTITYTFPKAFIVAPGACRFTQTGGTNAPLVFFSSGLSTTSVVFTSQTVATASATIIGSVDCQ